AALELFRSQHLEHAALFEGTTTKLGGQAFTKANPAVMSMLDPAIKAMKDEKTAVALAQQLESMTAATYFAVVGAFNDKTLDQSIMSVAGVEARHLAFLGGIQAVPNPLQTTDGAIPAGTGVS